MRSRKLSPGLAVTRTTIRSERTRVPPVTALRSPPDSRITGADSPVIADSSTVAAPSTTSPSAATISLASTTNRSPLRSALPATRSSLPSSLICRAVGIRLGAAQRLSLCFAASFGHRLGKVGEEHREPKPRCDGKIESGHAGASGQIAHEEDRRRRRSNLDDEHHRVARLATGVELLERVG